MTQACSLPSVTVIPLTLKQSRGRAWPTPIMDLRPILRFAFACRVLQADLDVGKKTVFMLPDDLPATSKRFGSFYNTHAHQFRATQPKKNLYM